MEHSALKDRVISAPTQLSGVQQQHSKSQYTQQWHERGYLYTTSSACTFRHSTFESPVRGGEWRLNFE